MQRVLDIVIVGGGPVGLSLARALEPTGLALALIEPRPPAERVPGEGWDNRVYAVSPGCAAFLDRCGAWKRVPGERVARIESMRVHGDDPRASLEFSAYDAGLRELAFIVENRRLQQSLWDVIGAQSAQSLAVHCPATWTSLSFYPDRAEIELGDGTRLAARLVVGADGAHSAVRAAAGIAAQPVDYRQLGVVANFACARPHRDTAFQWFMRDGVLALLPLPGARVSMVWSIADARGRELLAMPPESLAAAVESASQGVLGSLSLLAPAAAFPLRLQRVAEFTKPRVALVGDAAHNVHPLAGQGVNLGFRDARALAAVIVDRGPVRDCGDHALLRRYERARKEDVAAMQFTTDGLQKLFSSDAVWLTRARNAGLGFVDRQSFLKTFLVHHAAA